MMVVPHRRIAMLFVLALLPPPAWPAGETVIGAIPAAAATVRADCLPPPALVDPRVPWAQLRLTPERAWELTRGAGVMVGVVDTGVDGTVPQLAGRVLRGIDLVNPGGGAANTDCFGHGTFIAGIIGAAPAAGAGFVGIAPEARILPIRVINGAEDGIVGPFAAGIRAAVNAGARVINVSASTTARDPRLVDAIDYAESRDVLVVAATANMTSVRSGANTLPAYPAALPTVLAVGAVNAAGQLASFSQAGPYIGLAAPGVDVMSLGPQGPGHWQGSGTSYAAPFVAGVAALVRAYRPSLSAVQVRHRLKVTADRPAADVPDPGLGWGIVNPLAAVSTVLPEEGAAGAPVVNLAARHPDLQAGDEVGRIVVLLGATAMLIVTGVAGLLAVLGPAGRRRRWRPARTVRVLSDPPPS